MGSTGRVARSVQSDVCRRGGRTMAIDVRGAAQAVAEAALGNVARKKKHGLSPWQALAIGAGLVTAGHVATGSGGRFVRELVQDHSSNGSREDEEPEHDEPEA